MAYPNEGTLVTDEREISISETWDSQTDWEAYQSVNQCVISNGVVMLEDLPEVPESTIGWYDATQLSLSNNDSVSTWSDESGAGNDITGGSPVYQTDQRNGNPTVSFDDVDDVLDVTYSASEGQPNTVIVVSTLPTVADSTLFDSPVSGARHHSWIDAEGDWNFYAGSAAQIDTSPDGSFAIRSFVFDSTASLARFNGSDVANNADVGSESLEGFRLNQNVADSNLGGIEVGEAMVYNADLSETGELSNEEQRLADKWGITL